MNKYEALKQIFEIEQIFEKVQDYNLNPRVRKIEINKLLEVLSRTHYNISKDMEMPAATVSKILTYLFPDKPKKCSKVCNYLFDKYGYKYCGHCTQVLPDEEFNKNSSTTTGLNCYCKQCHSATNATTQTGRTSKYRAAKLNRTPVWANLDKIKEIYERCPEGYHVDHIVPLQGDLVSGLHVESNLQYLTSTDNLKKHNSFSSDSLAV